MEECSSSPHPCQHLQSPKFLILAILTGVRWKLRVSMIQLTNHIELKKGTLLHCWWDCKLVQPLWKSVWRFLRKLDIVLSEDPAILLLGIYPEDVPTSKKNTCSTMFIAALFIIARSLKEPRYPSTKEWIHKMWYIYTMEYYSAFKKQ